MAFGPYATSSTPTPAVTGTRNAEEAARQVRIVLRPVASPLPLAFAAFGIGSVVFALQQLGVIEVKDAPSVDLLLTVFLAPLQLIAAFYAFWSRETLAATGLSMLAVTWPATLLVSQKLPVGATSTTLGCFYLALGGFLLLLAAPGLVGKPLIGSLIVVAGARFIVSGLYQLLGHTPIERASGVLGLVIAAIGAYGALALGLEDVQHRTVLPVGRRGEARIAFEGDLATQMEPLEHEAGVRRQL
jgi:succinate-acetate transporter protein